LLLVCRRWLPRWTGWCLTALFAASLCLSLYWGELSMPQNFFLLPSRAWELLLGCLGAWAVHHNLALPQKLARAAPDIGLGLILLSVLLVTGSRDWPNSRSLAPTLGALFILIAPPPGAAFSLSNWVSRTDRPAPQGARDFPRMQRRQTQRHRSRAGFPKRGPLAAIL